MSPEDNNTHYGHYATSTNRFLTEMTVEDLEGGDIESVEWAGEAKPLTGLEAELQACDEVIYEIFGRNDLIKMDTSFLVFDNSNGSCFNRNNFRANTMIALCHTQSL